MDCKDEKQKKELRELVDAASLLPDDRVYTWESYRDFIQALAYAKVTLASEADDAKLDGAFSGLREAVDALTLKDEKPPKKEDPLHKALPFLLGGALLGGVYLGCKLKGGRKKSDKEEK